jgi:hypothetical protein
MNEPVVTAPPAAPYLDQIIEHCQNARFTGLLRMRTRQGEGELWFLSGIQDDARFGVSHGDEAMQRMARANDPSFELLPRLPPPAAGSKKSYPLEGPLGDVRPVDLFRLCETNAITCTLELRQGSTTAIAHYQVGELLTVESESADATAIGAMLEWSQGSYRFELPPLELPAGVPAYKPPSTPLMESVIPPAAAESKSDEQAAAKRKADEQAAAQRKADEQAATQRKADEQAATQRKADEQAATQRKADEQAAAQRKREEAAAAKRKAKEEAAARRKSEEEAAAQQKAAEEAIRRKAVSVHRQIAVGGGAHAPRALSEPPRPSPRADEAPSTTLFAPEGAVESRVDEIAEAWRKAEEAAEARLKGAAEPTASEPPAAEKVEPAPVSEAEPAVPASPSSEKEPAREVEPTPQPKATELEQPRAEKKPRARLPSVPSEPPPPKRALWPLVLVLVLVLGALAYFFGTR